jgi:hypothetical protein
LGVDGGDYGTEGESQDHKYRRWKRFFHKQRELI